MNSLSKFAVVGVLCAASLPATVQAETISPAQLGILQCAVLATPPETARPDENVLCVFNAANGSVNMYHGQAVDENIDIAEIKGGVMRWTVFAAGSPQSPVTGTYKTADAPADLTLPSHTKILLKDVGGGVILKPDVTPGDGILNFAVGISSLTLVGF
jgi:hypothetical protein